MVQESHPFDGRDWLEGEFSRWGTLLQNTGVVGVPGSTALQVVPGIGLNVIVRAGAAYVRGHYYRNTADLVLPISSPGGSTRLDYVVLDLDPAQNSIGASVVTGTPGAGLPTLTQSAAGEGQYQEALSVVTVPTGATSVTCAPVTRYVGARIVPCLSTQRPPNPAPGNPVYETDTKLMRIWDGTQWIRYRSEFTAPTMLRARNTIPNLNGPANTWVFIPINQVAEVYGDGGSAFTINVGDFGRGVLINRAMLLQVTANGSINTFNGQGYIRIMVDQQEGAGRVRREIARSSLIGIPASQGTSITSRPVALLPGDVVYLQGYGVNQGISLYTDFEGTDVPPSSGGPYPTPVNVTLLELTRL